MTAIAAPASRQQLRILAVVRDVLARPSGAIGLTLVLVHVLVALISPLIVP